MVPARLGLFVTVCAVILSSTAGARPAGAPRVMHSAVAMSAAAMRIGRSVGSPTTGHLIGGSHIEETPYLRVVPFYAGSDARWGLGPLVDMIERAARQVRKKYPDAVLSVGHLSRRGGGEIDRHASHESGRDADIAFYVKNYAGKPVLSDRFVPFRADGTAGTWPGAYFDDERNWLLVTSFVTDPVAHVSHIFVASPLRARLLAYAARIGAPVAVRNRAAELLMQPRGSLPHDDHFHVRITCPSGMHECIEFPMRKGGPVYARVPAPHPPHARGRANPGSVAHGAGRTPSADPAARPAQAGSSQSSKPDRKGPTSASDAPWWDPPPAVLSTPSGPADPVDPIDDADGDL
ncbi:penicillin-insensitive murein endopeptidase [Pendulispora albinea]|uniref:Penicillin-insensitive murein endopeptidase n=1 Tax=Pendulispora albinea TaxID=2741071 RepID=A0ABZ2M575_9BACT